MFHFERVTLRMEMAELRKGEREEAVPHEGEEEVDAVQQLWEVKE